MEQPNLLRDSLKGIEGKYQMLFETSRDGIALIDAETAMIIDCNKEYQNLTGRSFEELIHMKVWETRPPESREKNQEIFREILDKGQGGGEFYYARPDNSRIYTEYISRLITIDGRNYIQSVVRDITKRVQREQEMENRVQERTKELQKAMRKLKMYSQRLEKISNQHIRALEEERKLIAIELHDRVTQDLISLCHMVNKLREWEDSSNQLIVEEILGRVRITLDETRNIMKTLYPTALSRYGLVKIMTQELGNLGLKLAVHTQFEHNLAVKLDPLIETTMYRIYHEALLNIEKHCRNVKNIIVFLKYRAGFLNMIIEDDGEGFDSKKIPPKDPSGLDVMRQRAELMEGRFVLRSKLGQGTKISVRIPVKSMPRKKQ
ncbi:MAG: PAS domain S-box protein [Dehalococcoides mccartyi]|uniref:PAS domain-containing sensor histidine kinase n=1 Tax=Dehalococcoides mccartyi TaxID=61435 RepID=UPI0030F500AC